jgi:hypothetical protein
MSIDLNFGGVPIRPDQMKKLIEMSEDLSKYRFNGLDPIGFSLVTNHWLARDWEEPSGQKLRLTKKGKRLIELNRNIL